MGLLVAAGDLHQLGELPGDDRPLRPLSGGQPRNA